MANNEPFVTGAGEKAAGANFYPKDMTKAEFEAAGLADKNSLYTFLRRGDNRQLTTIPYREQFKPQVEKAAVLFRTSGHFCRK